MEKTVLVCLLNRTREVTFSTEPGNNDNTAVLLDAIQKTFADVDYVTPSSELILQV